MAFCQNQHEMIAHPNKLNNIVIRMQVKVELLPKNRRKYTYSVGFENTPALVKEAN